VADTNRTIELTAGSIWNLLRAVASYAHAGGSSPDAGCSSDSGDAWSCRRPVRGRPMASRPVGIRPA
jgi:hypothetical protein